jgi:hypothetical protein
VVFAINVHDRLLGRPAVPGGQRIALREKPIVENEGASDDKGANANFRSDHGFNLSIVP